MNHFENELINSVVGEIDQGFTSAAQIYVSVWDEILCDIAVGGQLPGHPIERTSTYSTVCAAKPLVSTCLAFLCESNLIDPNEFVSNLLPGCESNPLKIEHLISHRAGLSFPGTYECRMSPTAWSDAGYTAEAILELSNPGSVEYSEILGWCLIRELIFKLSGEPPEQYLDDWLTSLGLGDEIWFSYAGDDELNKYNRIAAYFDTDLRLPLLHETSVNILDHPIGCAFGAQTCASGLGRWYQLLLKVLNGAGFAGFPSDKYLRKWLSARRDSEFDQKLRKVCSFRGGFMSNLHEHGFGGYPDVDSIGHSGFLGNSYAILDPKTGIVISAIRSGISGKGSRRFPYSKAVEISRIYSLIKEYGLEDERRNLI